MMRHSLLIAIILGLPACATLASHANDRALARDFASARLSVMVRGRGPDLILIPGLAAHRDVWAGVGEALDDRYRLHFVQVNGFAGFAPNANAEGLVAAPVAEGIARYVREAGLDHPALIGHSMGGTIAMMVAARYPDLVGRVMLVDSPPFIGIAFGPPGTTAESVRSTADQLRSRLLSDTTSSSGIPLSAGEFEAVLRQSFTNAPQTRFVRIDSSNHYIQIDQPARFVAEVDAFMRR